MGVRHFGTDGIRGRANSPSMNADLALRVGQAAGSLIKGKGHSRPRVVIGKDTRLSGYMIETGLTAGFISVGVDVLLLGPMPTPAVAMLTNSMRADLGVMITASHNPHVDNGIKLFGADGRKISESDQEEIENQIDADKASLLADAQDLGRARRLEGVHARYVEFAKRVMAAPLDLSGLRVVLDAANGASYRVAPQTLWELGAEVIEIGTSPDGTNINKQCGSMHPEAVGEQVQVSGADIGIALDGDGDRLVVVDEKGVVVDGNHLLGFLAAEWSGRGRLKSDCLVTTEMANLGVDKFLSQIGIRAERTKVGDRYVVEAMQAGQYNLGGEPSGHIIFGDSSFTGDGLVAALQVITMVRDKGARVSDVCRPFSLLPERQLSIETSNKAVLSEQAALDMIAKAKARFEGKGRILVRASGTEPVIRVLGESEDPADLAFLTEFAASLKALAG